MPQKLFVASSFLCQVHSGACFADMVSEHADTQTWHPDMACRGLTIDGATKVQVKKSVGQPQLHLLRILADQLPVSGLPGPLASLGPCKVLGGSALAWFQHAWQSHACIVSDRAGGHVECPIQMMLTAAGGRYGCELHTCSSSNCCGALSLARHRCAWLEVARRYRG